MEMFKFVFTALFVLAVAVSEIRSEVFQINKLRADPPHPALNTLDHYDDGFKSEHSLQRQIKQNNKESENVYGNDIDKLKPGFNPFEHLFMNQDTDGFQQDPSIFRVKRQYDNRPEHINANKLNPPPAYNPLEDLILHQDKSGSEQDATLSRVKRQYGRRYPYPIPIIVGGGFGGYGGGFGRGFGGRGFGGGRGGFGGGRGGFGGGRGGFGGGRGGFGGGRGGGRGK